MEYIEFDVEKINFKQLIYDFLKTDKNIIDLKKENIQEVNQYEYDVLDGNVSYKIKIEIDTTDGTSFMYNAESYLDQNEMDYLVLIAEREEKIYLFKKEKLLNWIHNSKDLIYERTYTYIRNTEEEKGKTKYFNLSINKEKINYFKVISKMPFSIEKENKLTSEDIKTQSYNITYDEYYNTHGRYTKKNEILEKENNIPSMSYILYSLLSDQEKIPQVDTVTKLYFLTNCEKIGDNLYRFKDEKLRYIRDENGEYIKNENGELQEFTFTYEDLAGRICRTYPSFIREVQVLLKLSENNPDFKVEYSLDNDLNGGIDILVHYKDNKYGIKVFQDSEKSKEYKKEKENRHNYSNINIIDLPMNSNNSFKAGDICLFNDDCINSVSTEIKNDLFKDYINMF